MPHLVLEYSANVIDPPEMRPLLLELHRKLAGTGEFRIEDIKSRAIRHETFAVAEGDADRSFVTLDIQILEGRSDAAKEGLSFAVLEVLQKAFVRAIDTSRCNVTAKVTDMHRSSYRKASQKAEGKRQK
ncbi:MAG: 5-carboxymethyl-2-hydroxymuconate Delta-isomerase [Thermoanaerobaculia bacterium]